MANFASITDAKRELAGQTAKITWAELERFFAAGKVIFVDDSLDLIDVGAALIMDNNASFEQWIAAAQIYPVTDAQAKTWANDSPPLWACAVAPWVLVQTVSR